jgi:hypothetical protein
MVYLSAGIQRSAILCCVGALMLNSGCQQSQSLDRAEDASQASVMQTVNAPSEKQKVEIAALIEAISGVMEETGEIAEVMDGSTDHGDAVQSLH